MSVLDDVHVDEQSDVIRMTADDVCVAVQKALSDIGMTFGELEDLALNEEFPTDLVRRTWIAVRDFGEYCFD